MVPNLPDRAPVPNEMVCVWQPHPIRGVGSVHSQFYTQFNYVMGGIRINQTAFYGVRFFHYALFFLFGVISNSTHSVCS